MSQIELNGYSEIACNGDSRQTPPGFIDVKGRISESDNAFIKAEARSRSLTACEYAGELLTEAIKAARLSSKAETERKLQEMFGGSWRDTLKELL